jgi:hypothetical protein
MTLVQRNDLSGTPDGERCAEAQRLSREWIEAHPPSGN